MTKRMVGITFVICGLMTAAFGGGVWEDAEVLLFSNFSGPEGSTVNASSRWVNDRNTSKVVDGSFRPDSSSIDAATKTAIVAMYSVTNEDVRILGEGGVTYVNEPCLHFAPYKNESGNYQSTFFTFPGCKKGGNGAHGKLDLANDSSYTICMRFKPGLCTPSSVWSERILLETGPSTGSDGIKIYYFVAPDGTYGNICVGQCGGALTVGGTSGNSELMVTNGVWADIAVICASNRIDVGVRHEKLFRVEDRNRPYASTQGGRRFTWKCGTYDPMATGKSLVPPYNYNRFNNKYSWTATTEANNRSITGSLHRYGFWTRALGRDEVYEYFSEAKRPNLLTVGPGGTGQAGEKMFRGTTGTDVMIDNRPGEWRKLPYEIRQNVANTINFSVDAAYAGLPQVLKITAGSGAGTASGTIFVKLDGLPLAALDIAAGGKVTKLIDGEKFSEGAHSLSYERADGGSGALVINAIELKGSWQVGKDDNIYSQTETIDDFTKSHVFSFPQYGHNPASVANGWLCDFPAGPRTAYYGTDVGTEDVQLSFPVDPDLIAARYRFRYEMKIADVYAQWKSTKWTYTMNFNGAVSSSFASTDIGVGDIVKVQLDDCLHGGSNTNTCSVRVTDPGSGTDGHYNNSVYADYYRIRILPPRSGIRLIFR